MIGFSYHHVLDLIILAAPFDITDLLRTTVMFTSISFQNYGQSKLEKENNGVRLYIKNYKQECNKLILLFQN